MNTDYPALYGSKIEYIFRNGSKAHVQELARRGWSSERLAEYFRHELTMEQIREWINDTN